MLGDFSTFGQYLEVLEGEGAKAVMPSHQLCLIIIGLHVIILLIGVSERLLKRIGKSANFVL